MKHLYMQLLPHQRASGVGRNYDPNLTELIFDLGAFRERMGIVFRLETLDRITLKVFYDDDQTFTALRLGYGERFIKEWPVPVPKPAPSSNPWPIQGIPRSQRPHSPPKVVPMTVPSAPWTGRPSRSKDLEWQKMLERIAEMEESRKGESETYKLDDDDGDLLGRAYRRMTRRAR